MNDTSFDDIRKNPEMYESVKTVFKTWYAPNQAYLPPQLKNDMLAYLYSCSSIPENKQKSILYPHSGGGGGGQNPNIFGTIIGLAIVVALAFVHR